jgi:DNA phosphorothioation-dependent restriction protein DptG
MKESLNIIRHTVNHIAFIVGAIVINEERLAFSKTYGEFSNKSGPILFDEHSESVGLVELCDNMISTSLSYPL